MLMSCRRKQRFHGDHRRKKYKFVETNLSRHGNVRYYFRHPKLGRTRLPDPVAIDKFSKAHQDCMVMAAKGQRKPKLGVSAFFQYVSYCKARAARKGIDCSISAKWVLSRYYAQGGKCLVSGIKMELRNGTEPRKSPYQLSVDRIDSKKGYTKSNCRLVILAVNLAMNNWGENVFLEIARRTAQERSATPDGPVEAFTDTPEILDY